MIEAAHGLRFSLAGAKKKVGRSSSRLNAGQPRWRRGRRAAADGFWRADRQILRYWGEDAAERQAGFAKPSGKGELAHAATERMRLRVSRVFSTRGADRLAFFANPPCTIQEIRHWVRCLSGQRVVGMTRYICNW